MRALKLLVIVMGVLIVVGVVALVGVMASRFAGRGGAGASAAGFGRGRIELPAGARVGAMQAAGDRLVLRLDLPGGAQQLLVVDPASGKALGTIDLQQQP